MINYKQTIYAAGDRTTKSNMIFTTGDVRAYILKLDFPGLCIEGCGLTVKAKRADDVVIVGYSEDPERYILQNNMYAVAGELRLEIALTAADGRYITTAEILAEVREGFGEPDITGDDRVPVLTELIIQATSAAEACNTAAGRAEAAAEAVNGHMTDPAAHAALFANKVDKVSGKGLSSNDYTDSEKQKVDIINISAGGGLSVGSSAHSRDFVGFAAGHDAIDESNNGAIQLGKGTNISDGTFQVYDYQIIDSNGHIPAERIPQMAGKVDKVSGKGLSSNDYSDADKAKLASVRSQVTFSAASGDIAVAAGVTTVVAVPLSGANITFTTPAAGEENTYHLLFSLASDSASLSFPTDVLWQNGRTPDFAAGAVYELIVTYDGTHYLGGVITYAAS